MKDIFRRIANSVSLVAGSPWVFILAVLIVLTWAFSGHYFDYSNTWQLIINTGTTIVTFLMVFLIQNTQNRDGKAMQLKLDELIRATRARESFIDIEDLSDEELAIVASEFRRLHDVSDHPVLKKFHTKLEAAHRHRNSGVGQVADQVVSILNHPIGAHEDSDKKSKKIT